MSTLSVRLPESVHKKLKDLAKKEGVSMNQFISLAVSEKLSVLLTVDYLKERAKKGNRKDFEDIMSQIPDAEPEDYDRL
ncbi:toxin-antitoxin system HicB family antitoxin [Balneolaceae bacterium ANBcel3]|nr:toxin-antitoxin system HicB family antitoxin [Balneolaceae bacterium ANBcel3]